jgi:hypothetical protein
MGGASSVAKAKASELEAAKLCVPDGQDFLRQLEFVSQQHGILEEVPKISNSDSNFAIGRGPRGILGSFS